MLILRKRTENKNKISPQICVRTKRRKDKFKFNITQFKEYSTPNNLLNNFNHNLQNNEKKNIQIIKQFSHNKNEKYDKNEENNENSQNIDKNEEESGEDKEKIKKRMGGKEKKKYFENIENQRK